MLSRISTCLGALILFIAIALAAPIHLAAQSHYGVVELGELGGTAGSANGINDRGWITGTDNLTGDLTTTATLWLNGSAIPLGTLESGPNSAVAWPVKNNNGVIVGISELPDLDPLGENFSCWPFVGTGDPTGRICKGFRWQNGQMTELPPFPGGYSSYATGVNNRGQVVGWAENGVHDSTCDPTFQILRFRAAIWQPDGTMQELPPLPGDSTSAATAINDLGQVVGISGDCGIAVLRSEASALNTRCFGKTVLRLILATSEAMPGTRPQRSTITGRSWVSPTPLPALQEFMKPSSGPKQAV